MTEKGVKYGNREEKSEDKEGGEIKITNQKYDINKRDERQGTEMSIV